MAETRVYRGWFIVEHPSRWVGMLYGDALDAPTLHALQRRIDEKLDSMKATQVDSRA